MLKEPLLVFGLSDTQAEVYLALLKVGSAGILEITRESGLPKSTCYDAINSLIKAGLVTAVLHSRKKKFTAANPNELIKRMKQKEDAIEKQMGALMGLYSAKQNKPKLELYQGKTGMKTAYSKLLETGTKELLIMGNETNFSGFYSWFLERFRNERVNKKLKCRYIVEDSKEARAVQKNDAIELRTTRLSGIMKGRKAELYISGKTVVFATILEKDPFVVVIENQEVASLISAMFEGVWNKTNA